MDKYPIIGVISDTHDRTASIDTALAFFVEHKVQFIVHCGDWKSVETARYAAEQLRVYGLMMRGVLGNNDIDVIGFTAVAADYKDVLTLTEDVDYFEFCGKKIAAYHGHRAPTLRQVTQDINSDVILLGHTHKPKIDAVDGRLLVNPGSTAFSIPRSKNFSPSVALINVVEVKAELHYL